jgi:hypothetical protein
MTLHLNQRRRIKPKVWQIYLLNFFFGIADAFAAPAAHTLLPSLVAPAQLPAANARSQGTQQVAMLVMLRNPPRVQSAVPHTNIVHSIVEGRRYAKNDVALRTLLLVASVLNFCISGPLSVGLAFLAKSEFHPPTAMTRRRRPC